MKWQDYVAVVEYPNRAWHDQPKAFIVRAVSVEHALTKAQRQHPDAKRHEVEMCRCSEINNDMCSAHYTYWGDK